METREYKGNEILVLRKNKDEAYPFSFGITKAKLILENIETIKEFINKFDKDINNKDKVNELMGKD